MQKDFFKIQFLFFRYISRHRTVWLYHISAFSFVRYFALLSLRHEAFYKSTKSILGFWFLYNFKKNIFLLAKRNHIVFLDTAYIGFLLLHELYYSKENFLSELWSFNIKSIIIVSTFTEQHRFLWRTFFLSFFFHFVRNVLSNSIFNP